MLAYISNVVNLIYSNTRSQNEALAKHAKTLIGPRTRGSTTSNGLGYIPSYRKLNKINHPLVTDADCYVIHAPELNGRIEAVALEFAWKKNLVVNLREGAHGPELFVDQSQNGQSVPEDNIYIIVGKEGNEDADFTWHPGEPLLPLDKGINPNTAVKLHNGE